MMIVWNQEGTTSGNQAGSSSGARLPVLSLQSAYLQPNRLCLRISPAVLKVS